MRERAPSTSSEMERNRDFLETACLYVITQSTCTYSNVSLITLQHIVCMHLQLLAVYVHVRKALHIGLHIIVLYICGFIWA